MTESSSTLETKENHKKGKLYLIPAPLIPYSPQNWEPDSLRHMIQPAIIQKLHQISNFIVESERTAQRFLSRILTKEHMERIQMLQINEHSSLTDIEEAFHLLLNGYDCGIISEAGMPCVADPGSVLVAMAHRHKILTIPMGSDSSLILALAASGLNGQQFKFLGYIPVQEPAKTQLLIKEGQNAIKDGAARLFIETPYRNSKTLSTCLQVLPHTLWLCMASHLGTDSPLIIAQSVQDWAKNSCTIPETPSVFCFGIPADELLRRNESRLVHRRNKNTFRGK